MNQLQLFTEEETMTSMYSASSVIVVPEFLNEDPRLTKHINVSFDWEGFHRWPNAPDAQAFLRNLHRHKFCAQADIQVYHSDREIEFFAVLNVIKTKILPYIDGGDENSPQSCEDMAQFILAGLMNEYGLERDYTISVYEDNENGGIVQWDGRS